MRIYLLVVLLFCAGAAHAQYRCAVGGKTTYSDVPCSANAQAVGAMQDQVTYEQRLDRARVNAREGRQLGPIESEKALDNMRHQRMGDAVAAQERAGQRERSSNCNRARSDKRWADRSVAIYKDAGWQNSLNQAKREQDSASSAMRDSCD